MGCGCGGNKGGSNRAASPKLPTTSNVAANLHPNAQTLQNIRKLAEERRKVERLKREHLIKTLLRP